MAPPWRYLSLRPTSSYKVFPFEGDGSFIVDGTEGLVSGDRPGIVGGPGADMQINYPPDFEHLIVPDQAGETDQNCSDLLGRPVSSH